MLDDLVIVVAAAVGKLLMKLLDLFLWLGT
jgi:hypothetical protein